MGLGKRISFALCAVIALTLVTGAVGWFSTTSIRDRLDRSIVETNQKLALVHSLTSNVFNMRIQERGILLFALSHSDDVVASSKANYTKSLNAAYSDMEKVRPLMHTPQEIELLNQIKQSVDDYKAGQVQVPVLVDQGNAVEAILWDKSHLVAVGPKIIATINKLLELETATEKRVLEESAQVGSRAQFSIAICLLLALPLGAVIVGMVGKTTSRLQQTADELQSAANELDGAATQMASASGTLANGATTQAASVQECSASTSELGSIATRNAENTRAADNLIHTAQSNFQSAADLLDQMIQSMAEIDSASAKVSNIIKTIDGIAFQTNILALNAAVEAARAGDAGAGFAVVADEVRSLAHRAADAAKETAIHIEESIAASASGKQKVNLVAKAIQSIAGDIQQTSQLVDEITLANKDQAGGVTNIVQSMVQIERITQQTAATAEESSAASAELGSQSKELQRIVHQLSQIVGSQAA